MNPGAVGCELLQADGAWDHLGRVAGAYCQPGSALPTARINKVPTREGNAHGGWWDGQREVSRSGPGWRVSCVHIAFNL